MKATELKRVDADYRCHLQAYLNFAAQAQKKSGKNKSKPVYSRFKKFYDYEKEIEKVMNREHEKSRFSGIEKFLKKGE